MLDQFPDTPEFKDLSGTEGFWSCSIRTSAPTLCFCAAESQCVCRDLSRLSAPADSSSASEKQQQEEEEAQKRSDGSQGHRQSELGTDHLLQQQVKLVCCNVILSLDLIS